MVPDCDRCQKNTGVRADPEGNDPNTRRNRIVRQSAFVIFSGWIPSPGDQLLFYVIIPIFVVARRGARERVSAPGNSAATV